MYALLGEELILFAKAIWYGSFLIIVYDGLRIWRNCVRHKNWLISLEDFVYWIWAGVYVFSRFFQENSGQLRGYFFVGLVVGALAWHWALSKYFVDLMSKVLCKVKILFEI